jgi:hypothetical protein
LSILNRPSDGLSTVLLALRRALIAYGPQDEERLRQLCAPEVGALKDPGMARRTLTRWIQLGVFEQTTGGRIALSADVKAIEADDLRRFRAALLRVVLADRNNPALTPDGREGEEERTEQSRAGDYTRRRVVVGAGSFRFRQYALSSRSASRGAAC